MAYPQRTDSGPGSGSVLVNLSADTVWPLTGRCPRRLRVDGAGTVSFVGLDGVTDTWTVTAGTVIDVAVQKVFGSGSTPATSATGVHAIW